MTNFEIATTVLSVIALVVSGVTCYLTILARFDGIVYTRKRAILNRVDESPCLVLECEFVNEGARPGAIEDILVEVTHEESGNRYVFIPFLTKDQFNVFQNYQISDFSIFSGVSLGAKQRRELFVVFKPQSDFKSPIGTLNVSLGICTNISKDKWKKPTPEMSLSISDTLSKNWNDSGGSPAQVPAIEIKQSRQKYLKERK
jgi:hypothetical protein